MHNQPSLLILKMHGVACIDTSTLTETFKFTKKVNVPIAVPAHFTFVVCT